MSWSTSSASERRQIRRYVDGECKVPKLVAERKREIARATATRSPANPGFRFIDLFAGIGGLRKGFEAIGGKCVFTSEWDRNARRPTRTTSRWR